MESHKLSELCRILTALEGLFVEDTSEVSRLSVTQPRSLLTHLIYSVFVRRFVCSVVVEVFLPIGTPGMR